jgi:hypothetical protein
MNNADGDDDFAYCGETYSCYIVNIAADDGDGFAL